MPLSWNEIRHRAITFTKEWTGVKSESAEKQTFWNEFFNVFGVPRRAVASFEEPVKNLSGHYGAIDLLWRGKLLVEHKSAGEDLGKAKSQAFDYIQALVNAGRLDEIPRYIIVSDFAHIALYDLEPDEQKDLPLFAGHRVSTLEFPLAEFHKRIHSFAFIPGYKQHKFEVQDPINIKAVQLLGDLHDALEAGGYEGHDLERLLVRILFCLFAEDTGIFEIEAFHLYLENRTAADGSDLGLHLARLFDVLNTAPEKRPKKLDESLASFRHVNGDLFAEDLNFADFDSNMRNALLACTHFDWSRISPAVFGALFQSVMEPKERRQIGGHYTNERDILKVARSLFLDDLRQEVDAIKADKSTRQQARLEEFQKKLAGLCFLDPACGCGNFLVITYRELRQLEIELLVALHTEYEATGDVYETTGAKARIEAVLNISELSKIDVDQFYVIEIAEWPARIAEVALWLMDHQMNIRLSEAFGQYYVRLPLRKSPHIQVGNALRLDWRQVISPDKCSFILGNPPFVGAKLMNDEQRADMAAVAGDMENYGLLDYVTAWYFCAADYIKGTGIVVGFVSTSSISQGEQVGVLWGALFQRCRMKIHFGHRTFPWESEARGKAHVHVVIIGFAASDRTGKRIYDYDAEGEKFTVVTVQNISPYLIEGGETVVVNRPSPICNVPEIGIGNKPIDDGNYQFTADERSEFLKLEPAAKPYFREFLGADEFFYRTERWTLWLKDCSPAELRKMPNVLERVEAVQKFRAASKSAPTRKLAQTPTAFHVENLPKSSYLLIPRHSSEKRKYIPFGYVSPKILAGDSCLVVSDATPYHFGVLSSEMHMAWMRQVAGRLESRYRYSAKLVYNNYPWPAAVTEKARAGVEAAAQAMLDARAQFPTATLADLYDPLTMPAALLAAHQALDRAVDRCYRPEPFTSDRQRVEYLFALYEQLTAPLLPKPAKKRRGKKEV